MNFRSILGENDFLQGVADTLTGAELAKLCFEKYGLYHDMAIKCDRLQLVSDKKLVWITL